MVEMTLDEIHEAELGMLECLDAFCEQHDISYYLAYGTLLGAIRHGGFIPWDDDADVWLLRKDYDRFLSLFEEDETYRLIRPFQPEYGFGWAKILDKRTAYRHESVVRPDDYGLTIDLFPLDCDGGEAFFQRMQKLSRLRKIKWYKHKAGSVQGPKRILKKVLARFVPERLIDERGFQAALDSGQKNGRVLNCFSRYTYKQESADASHFVPGLKLAFEGEHHFSVPRDPERVLERIYGKDWRVPVVDSHPTKVFWRDGFPSK
ncbi:LPS biosynthesis protein [Slackia heliotrinireducens]|uniref:LPS biosynthesis protein n=1 Tax=Slackia heliotrinireducens (strain ATCC 29202 / DSM 20476 / NCTC 11029 / RHS 1) TaxID=471855 RepID=C7N5T1_SLAHD|nr:LicD family protein [Slackia heliotrinireducens]ACV22266.1 LPS biosynthesis protein [Slackia heliotrinireducens DSM 20476]VEH00433.1 LPS biosynthesis protein [Slackia heliotrinireducens]